MSSPDDERPAEAADEAAAPVESEPAGTEVPQPAATADDARPDADSSDTQGTGVDAPVAQQEDAGTPEGAGTDEAKGTASPAADAPADATAPEQPAAEVAEDAPVEVPVAEPAFDEHRSPILETITEKLGDAVLATELQPGQDAWVRVRLDAWAETAKVLRDDLGFTYFCFLSAIDWLPSPFGKSEDDSAPAPVEPGTPLEHGVAGGETRFQLFARLERPGTSLGITVKADVGDDLLAPTWTELFAGANWHEREAREMFGIDFVGHPYPVNLYLPGGFEGHPLRKDFPLLSRMVKPWPGLVDVEPMPGEDPEAAEAEAEA